MGYTYHPYGKAAMTRPCRIGIVRIAQESNAYSPIDTTFADFQRTHFVEGADLLEICRPDRDEVPGFAKNAELSGFVQAVSRHPELPTEIVPLFSAWAIPNGPLSRETFDHFCHLLRHHLQAAGPLDGVFFSCHGAMNVRGVDNPEGIFFQIVREYIGDEAPLAVTMDLHANLTREKVAQVSILCGYRTNPHRDHARTGARAGDLLLRTLYRQIQPTGAWRSLPMILGGGMTLDFLPPMRSIFKRMTEMEQDPRVLDCTVFMCHPWLEESEPGWAVWVHTNNEQYLAEQLADELAERCWQVRHKLPPAFMGPETMLRKARKDKLARALGTICVCDASDVVGAGGTGENTALLKFLQDNAPDLRSYLPVRDAVVLEELWGKEPGTPVAITVGGKLHPEVNFPVKVDGILRTCNDIPQLGRAAVVDAGPIQLVITEGPPLAMSPQFYRDLGLEPWQADLVVVKSLFPFHLFFWKEKRRSFYVRTRGITDMDLGLTQTTASPVFPKDPVEHWQPIDRKRRLLPSQNVFLSEEELAQERAAQMPILSDGAIHQVPLNRKQRPYALYGAAAAVALGAAALLLRKKP